MDAHKPSKGIDFSLLTESMTVWSNSILWWCAGILSLLPNTLRPSQGHVILCQMGARVQRFIISAYTIHQGRRPVRSHPCTRLIPCRFDRSVSVHADHSPSDVHLHLGRRDVTITNDGSWFIATLWWSLSRGGEGLRHWQKGRKWVAQIQIKLICQSILRHSLLTDLHQCIIKMTKNLFSSKNLVLLWKGHVRMAIPTHGLSTYLLMTTNADSTLPQPWNTKYLIKEVKSYKARMAICFIKMSFWHLRFLFAKDKCSDNVALRVHFMSGMSSLSRLYLMHCTLACWRIIWTLWFLLGCCLGQCDRYGLKA